MSTTTETELTNIERETQLPIKPMEVISIPARGHVDPNLPQGIYSSHEDLIAYKDTGSEAIFVIEDSSEARKQLEDRGLLGEGGYGVPYTGAGLTKRSEPGYAEHISNPMDYNRAAREANLGVVDWEKLSEEQKNDLKKIGFQGGGPYNLSLLNTSQGNVLEVSSGFRLDEEALQARLENIGTYAIVEAPIGNYAVPLVAYTDEHGNEAVAPLTNTLEGLLNELGYRRFEQPTFDVNLDPQLNMYDPRVNKLNAFRTAALQTHTFNGYN